MLYVRNEETMSSEKQTNSIMTECVIQAQPDDTEWQHTSSLTWPSLTEFSANIPKLLH